MRQLDIGNLKILFKIFIKYYYMFIRIINIVVILFVGINVGNKIYLFIISGNIIILKCSLVMIQLFFIVLIKVIYKRI